MFYCHPRNMPPSVCDDSVGPRAKPSSIFGHPETVPLNNL